MRHVVWLAIGVTPPNAEPQLTTTDPPLVVQMPATRVVKQLHLGTISY